MPESGTIGEELLEREHDLATIDAGIDAAKSGHGGVVLIKGNPGVGKTSLLAEARRRAADAGLEVLSARGGELERSLAFGVAQQLFEARVRGAAPGERRSLLAGSAGLARAALGLEVGRDPTARSKGAGDASLALQHGLYWLCANVAERKPLMLAVDDLHWADESSARWLLYLARRLEGMPVLLVLAARAGEPGADQQLLAALESEPLAETLEPALLSRSASARLAQERLGGDADQFFCDACHRVTGGNPFLLNELLTAVEEDSITPTADSVASLDRLGPEAISRSLLLRLARLPPAAGPLARAVSVLGASAELRHAAALAELDKSTGATAADALAGAGVLAPGRPLAFAHPLLRTAIYGDIPEGERSLAHMRAARLLAEEGSDSERLASHLLEAEPAGDQWVVERLEQAAQSALARGVPSVAIIYLRRALVEPASPSARPRLLRVLLAATTSVVDWSALEAVSDDPLGELTADIGVWAESTTDLARWLFATGRAELLPDLADRLAAIAREAGDHALAWTAESGLLAAYEVRPAEALERIERYKGLLEPGSDEHLTWLALGAWFLHFQPGSTAAACAERARQAVADDTLLERFPDTPFFGQPVLVLLRADELGDAERCIDRLSDSARRRGSILDFIAATGLRSQLALKRGDVLGAVDRGRSAHELVLSHESMLQLPVMTIWLVEALVAAGAYDEAERVLATAGMSGPIPDHYWFTPVLLPRARLHLAQGRREEALADLRHVFRYSEGNTWPATFPIASEIALLVRAGGDEEEPRKLLDQELAAAQSWGTPRGIGVAKRALGLVEGGETGIRALREAVDALRASPARLELSRALTDLGAALRRAKQRSEAREVLREALELATRCGAEPIEARAREELEATGARPRRVMRTGVDALTPSELRIARMAAEGMENKEIAQALFVTVKTVETHLGHVYAKLEIASRKELPKALV